MEPHSQGSIREETIDVKTILYRLEWKITPLENKKQCCRQLSLSACRIPVGSPAIDNTVDSDKSLSAIYLRLREGEDDETGNIRHGG